jgi:AcrR family transcriptional regulator
VPTREPVSRRDRPAKPPLTRRGIVEAAIRVMLNDGLERATMRRLAQELDTGPASIYVYFRNTAELHGAVLDELLSEMPIPSRQPTGGGWKMALQEMLVAYTMVLFRYPSLARSVLTLRPSGPNYLRLIDAMLTQLIAGGVPPSQAAWGVNVLLQLATSTAAEQGTREESADAKHEEDALETALREALPEAYPSIAAVGADLLSGSGADRLRWSFDALIAGIAAVPTPPAEIAASNT